MRSIEQDREIETGRAERRRVEERPGEAGALDPVRTAAPPAEERAEPGAAPAERRARGKRGGKRRPSRSLEMFFLGLSAAAVAVPGLNVFGTEAWWPPQSDLFRFAASFLGAAVIALLMMMRKRIRELPRPRVLRLGAAGLGLGLVLVVGYYFALDRAVLDYTYSSTNARTVVPFRVGSWATPELLKLSQTVGRPDGGVPPQSTDALTEADIELLHQRFGPDGMAPFVPRSAVNGTIRMLFFLYCACLGLIVASFTALGIRMGHGSAELDEESWYDERMLAETAVDVLRGLRRGGGGGGTGESRSF
ncbi:MAG TPA: hypothetical protein VF746_14365 [Longimicrobium sp.]|jgi:hypothetical protein